jgi:hypothetical protein
MCFRIRLHAAHGMGRTRAASGGVARTKLDDNARRGTASIWPGGGNRHRLERPSEDGNLKAMQTIFSPTLDANIDFENAEPGSARCSIPLATAGGAEKVKCSARFVTSWHKSVANPRNVPGYCDPKCTDSPYAWRRTDTRHETRDVSATGREDSELCPRCGLA